MYSGYLTWVFLGMVLVLSTLAVVLASLSRKLIGKGLIVASIVAFFLPDVLAAAKIVSMIVTHTYHAAQELDRWFSVMSLVYRSGVACLALFIFSNYIEPRTKLGATRLFFRFSGRIPRSAFWIAICILLPLSALMWIAPYQDPEALIRHVELPGIVFWVLYACFSVLHFWISLALYTKRWHDCSKSGWMSLVIFVPVVGIFWFYGNLGFVRGTDGPNGYGEDPLSNHLVEQTSATGSA